MSELFSAVLNSMNLVLGIASLVSLLVVIGSGFYIRGFARGYEVGRREADNWWIAADQQADQARQSIWRENPKTGKAHRRERT